MESSPLMSSGENSQLVVDTEYIVQNDSTPEDVFFNNLDQNLCKIQSSR